MDARPSVDMGRIFIGQQGDLHVIAECSLFMVSIFVIQMTPPGMLPILHVHLLFIKKRPENRMLDRKKLRNSLVRPREAPPLKARLTSATQGEPRARRCLQAGSREIHFWGFLRSCPKMPHLPTAKLSCGLFSFWNIPNISNSWKIH
jgi:hypothetical protein